MLHWNIPFYRKVNAAEKNYLSYLRLFSIAFMFPKPEELECSEAKEEPT